MLLLPETVDAPALAQEMAELRAARSASVHHHAPPTLVGAPAGGDASSSAADEPAAYEALLAGLKPEHAATMGQLHRYNSVRKILETPPDVGGTDPTKGLKGVVSPHAICRCL